MATASLDLQKAIIDALKASAPVTALVGERIYDDIPTNKVFPYVSYGPEQESDDSVDCITAYEIFVQLDIWSRAMGKVETKRIAGAIRAALHYVDLDLEEQALVLIKHERTDYLKDPDGLTKHGAVSFKALVDEVA